MDPTGNNNRRRKINQTQIILNKRRNNFVDIVEPSQDTSEVSMQTDSMTEKKANFSTPNGAAVLKLSTNVNSGKPGEIKKITIKNFRSKALNIFINTFLAANITFFLSLCN